MASVGHCDILCERLEHLGVWDPRGVVEAIPTDTEEWLFIKPMFLAAQIPQLKAKGPWAAWGIGKGQRLLFSCPSPPRVRMAEPSVVFTRGLRFISLVVMADRLDSRTPPSFSTDSLND